MANDYPCEDCGEEGTSAVRCDYCHTEHCTECIDQHEEGCKQRGDEED